MQHAPEDPAPADAPANAPVERGLTFPSPAAGFAPPAQAPASSQSLPLMPSAPSPSQAPASGMQAAIADLTAAAAPAAAAAAPSDGVPVTHEAPPLDLDDLARRVYGQVRTQLRSELLIDRERAGLLTDFR
jgi:hypothetical protein